MRSSEKNLDDIIILIERHCDQQSNNLFSKQLYVLIIDNIWYAYGPKIIVSY